MATKLLCYSLSDLSPSIKVKLCRELYGYKNYSNYGSYVYRKGGILNKIKHKKIFNSILIVNKKDTKVVVRTMKKYGAKHYVFDVFTKFKV